MLWTSPKFTLAGAIVVERRKTTLSLRSSVLLRCRICSLLTGDGDCEWPVTSTLISYSSHGTYYCNSG
ncbi:hypothetical protein OPV22_022537 [Ensete ventricosum]|uniref:Uncharacterized protein n=1 Tax=Ensete ventricosum TaxID=4639 RepID=A0AAV8QSR1_ENSVE|nr:hypothetical protein OPV22_022537 [Ensete ventricosum]